MAFISIRNDLQLTQLWSKIGYLSDSRAIRDAGVVEMIISVFSGRANSFRL